MKKRLIKKQFSELKLSASLYKCLNCGGEQIYAGLMKGEWDVAVECGDCSAVVVFNVLNISEATDAFFGARKIPGYSELPEEAKLAIQEEKDSALLGSIPPCPSCYSHNYKDLRLKDSYPFKGFYCKKCGTDLAKSKNSTCQVLPEYANMDAWWYEVVNDDKPETPDNH